MSVMRMIRTTMTASVGAAVLLLGVAPAANAGKVKKRSGALVATLSAGSHTPKAGRKWPVTVTARTPSGKARSARLVYDFLYKGRVVSHQSNYRFKGKYTDNTFVWPGRAVGYRLTLRAVITSGRYRVNLDYAIRVRR